MSLQKFSSRISPLAKKCLIATESEKPKLKKVHSNSGGDFYGLPSEEWPEFKSKKLIPLLSICTSELPFVPPKLNDIALLNIFAFDGHYDWGDENKGAIQIKTYNTLDNLVILKKPAEIHTPEVPISWKEQTDYPSCYSLISDEEFDEYCKYESQLNKQFPQQKEVKIGGYPYFIQQYHNSPDYLIQFCWKLDSPFNKVYMFGDAGVAHFSKTKDNWITYWESS